MRWQVVRIDWIVSKQRQFVSLCERTSNLEFLLVHLDAQLFEFKAPIMEIKRSQDGDVHAQIITCSLESRNLCFRIEQNGQSVRVNVIPAVVFAVAYARLNHVHGTKLFVDGEPEFSATTYREAYIIAIILRDSNVKDGFDRILSIITARLGAGAVTGADLDHDVLAIAEANVEANEVADRIRLTEASLLGLRERFDVIVANIVIGDLRPLMAPLVDRCDRVLIVSGFLDSHFERLLADVDVSVLERTRAEGWGCAVLAPVV